MNKTKIQPWKYKRFNLIPKLWKIMMITYRYNGRLAVLTIHEQYSNRYCIGMVFGWVNLTFYKINFIYSNNSKFRFLWFSHWTITNIIERYASRHPINFQYLQRKLWKNKGPFRQYVTILDPPPSCNVTFFGSLKIAFSSLFVVSFCLK